MKHINSNTPTTKIPHQMTNKKKDIKRERKTHSFNPIVYKQYQTFCEDRDVPMSRNIERHMMRQLNSA